MVEKIIDDTGKPVYIYSQEEHETMLKAKEYADYVKQKIMELDK